MKFFDRVSAQDLKSLNETTKTLNEKVNEFSKKIVVQLGLDLSSTSGNLYRILLLQDIAKKIVKIELPNVKKEKEKLQKDHPTRMILQPNFKNLPVKNTIFFDLNLDNFFIV